MELGSFTQDVMSQLYGLYVTNNTAFQRQDQLRCLTFKVRCQVILMGRKYVCVHVPALLKVIDRYSSQHERTLETIFHIALLKEKQFVHGQRDSSSASAYSFFFFPFLECIGTGTTHFDFLFPFMTTLTLF